FGILFEEWHLHPLLCSHRHPHLTTGIVLPRDENCDREAVERPVGTPRSLPHVFGSPPARVGQALWERRSASFIAPQWSDSYPGPAYNRGGRPLRRERARSRAILP